MLRSTRFSTLNSQAGAKAKLISYANNHQLLVIMADSVYRALQEAEEWTAFQGKDEPFAQMMIRCVAVFGLGHNSPLHRVRVPIDIVVVFKLAWKLQLWGYQETCGFSSFSGFCLDQSVDIPIWLGIKRCLQNIRISSYDISIFASLQMLGGLGRTSRQKGSTTGQRFRSHGQPPILKTPTGMHAPVYFSSK